MPFSSAVLPILNYTILSWNCLLNKTHFKAFKALHVFHWLMDCYNNKWTSLNLCWLGFSGEMVKNLHQKLPFIYSFAFFSFYRYNTNSQSDQLPDGQIAWLVEHCTGIAEVMSSNPVQASRLLIAIFIYNPICDAHSLCYDLWKWERSLF